MKVPALIRSLGRVVFLALLAASFLSATVTLINLTTQVSGVLPIANGGTNSTTHVKAVFSGFCTGAASTSLAVSLAPLGSTATTCTTTATANVGIVVPEAGTIANFYVIEGTSQKSGTTLAWTLQKCTAGSCSATTLTCTVANAGKACNDTSHSFTVAAGDIVQIKSGSTASSSETLANVSASMEFTN